MLTGLSTNEAGTTQLHIHSEHGHPTMAETQGTTLQHMALMKATGKPVKFGFSENEQASIIEAYKYRGIARRRNPAEMLAVQREHRHAPA